MTDRIFSGDYSVDMWDAINEAKSKSDLRDALYLVCCRLQELEAKLAKQNQCPYCDNTHEGQCPKVKAIEYFENGQVKRIEFRSLSDYLPPVQPLPDYRWKKISPWTVDVDSGGTTTVTDRIDIVR